MGLKNERYVNRRGGREESKRGRNTGPGVRGGGSKKGREGGGGGRPRGTD